MYKEGTLFRSMVCSVFVDDAFAPRKGILRQVLCFASVLRRFGGGRDTRSSAAGGPQNV